MASMIASARAIISLFSTFPPFGSETDAAGDHTGRIVITITITKSGCYNIVVLDGDDATDATVFVREPIF